MEVSATFPPDPQPPIRVQPGQGALQPSAASDPAPSRAPRPAGRSSGGSRERAVAAGTCRVIAAVGDQHARLAPRPPDPPADWRDRIQQRLELGDVMTVAAGQEHGQRDAGRVGQDVVCLLPGRARSTGLGPIASSPLARTWEASTAARVQSI